MKKIVITSGYFDPIHVGHIEYLRKASELGYHICIVNSDAQAQQKKGYSFMTEHDRCEILSQLPFIDEVRMSTSKDSTVCDDLRELACKYGDTASLLLFAKGGDRDVENIPERSACQELGIAIVVGLGDKIRSSSELVNRAKEHENE